ncbi:DUF2177 family protein [Caulobacter segnis]|uniref:DUF2177 family protein n=1 Tax=Caulobacter segnis TaxID=88688 RepID=UPI00240FA6A2|nr:DUF2177 family protein [Caulobacter segnis]MDG2523471.1 DUF2177 family protein [Caulobacter segnis]
MQYVFAYLGAGVGFVVLDAIWLTLATPRLYKPILGEILAEKVSMPAAVAFYLIYLAGIVLFAVEPGLKAGSATRTALMGAALGFVAYATYDLTNQATLKVWSWKITAADLTWGVVLTCGSALAGYAAARFSERF